MSTLLSPERTVVLREASELELGDIVIEPRFDSSNVRISGQFEVVAVIVQERNVHFRIADGFANTWRTVEPTTPIPTLSRK